MQSATVSRISPVVDRSEHEIVTAVDAVTVLLEKPVGRGYIWEKVVTPTQVAPVGAELKGHERHYSIREKPTLAIKLERGSGRRRRAEQRC
jgi:cobyrinic acid a,c-diamide synthase